MMKTKHFPLFISKARPTGHGCTGNHNDDDGPSPWPFIYIFASIVLLLIAMAVFYGPSTQQEAKAIQTDVQDVIPTEVVEAPGWRTK